MEDMRIYVASLSDYNDGRLEGKWLDLSDYSDASELMEAIQEMLDEITEKYNDGEVREEWAVHDYEGIPSTLASEYMGEQDFQQLYDIAEVAEDSGVPLEVLMERAGDTGSDDYKALAESLVMVVDGNDESDIVSQMEDEMGELGYDFWSNYIFITETDKRLLYGEDVDRFREDILYENPDMDEDEAERQAEEMADEEESRRNDDLIGYIEEMGYEGDLPNWVMKDYEDAWKYALSYDYDVIYHDGEMYVFSNNYSVGGTILSGMVGAYIGYKYAQSNKGKKRGRKFTGGGGVDEKFFHESRLLDYGFSKDIDSAGNRIYEKGLYKIVINPKDKTYTAILNGRPETHKIYDKKFALGRFIDLEFGTKYAKGGMLEHGLKVGDEIMGYTKDVNELHVVNRKNNDEWHSVDLDDGKRYAGGGGVDGKKYYMLFNISEFGGQPMYNFTANSKQEVIDILLESYENITKHKMYSNEVYSMNDMDESKYNSYINDDYAYVTANAKEYDRFVGGYKSVAYQKSGKYAQGGGISGLDDLIRG